jgi:uncharacterized protein (DUF58 family)
MLSFADLRAEAESLAGNLPPFDQVAGYRTTAHSGAAARQRAGHGEDFWQYRSQTPEDSAAAIDWRRSATGDELFIREHELQSARLLSLWADASPGFDWKSDAAPLTKADCARIILSAIGIRYSETGDMVGVIDGMNGVTSSHHLVGPMVDDFMHLEGNIPGIPRSDTAQIILASDFYGDIEGITHWVERETIEGRSGILLQIIDPMERDFPFTGRVKFRLPGSKLTKIFGRTELLKDAYMERFHARQDALASLSLKTGWQYFTHCTSDPMAPTAFSLMSALHVEGTS